MESKRATDKTTLQYQLRRSSRATRIRLSIDNTNQLLVTAPPCVPAHAVQRFVIENSAWVNKRQQQIRKIKRRYRLEIPPYSQCREKAKAAVAEKISHFNQCYCFRFNKIIVRNQKTRWGSCSARGTLSFNYRIILLPEEIANYLESISKPSEQ